MVGVLLVDLSLLTLAGIALYGAVVFAGGIRGLVRAFTL
jgi:hypothetical protein